ncbi:cytochrome c oxidase subunit II [uncultured Sphingomonas sp.]|uniref:cytochrome c oxidase subunit II n=1 Tax=uncultured Sphingomonas sp. TaxID=158754 RepID=UPI0035CBA0DE
MRKLGLSTLLPALVVAAGLALAGPAAAQQPAHAPAGAASTAPTTVAAKAPAAPASPLLAQDGAPAMAVDPVIGHPNDGVFGIQTQVTRNGEFARWFHNSILFPVITVISLFVLALLVFAVVRFRKAANPIPSRTSHNTAIEVAWTLIPVIMLVMIAVPSIGLLQAQFKPAPAGAITLKATGNQWYWTYNYPDLGDFEVTANLLKEKDQVQPGDRARTDADGPRLLAVDNRVVLPVGVPIRLITTSADVIHSWAIPAFWIKLDAVPGRLNETSFTIERPGLYFGQCSELCGARHAFMPIAVEAVDRATFARWVVAKGGHLPGAIVPSDKVIPQPGANGAVQPPAGAFKTPPAGMNPPSQAAPLTQGATGNPSGAGNPGQ